MEEPYYAYSTVIGKVVKSEDIPAATQLFTPNWIVKYLVQNSLGAQWMRTYPDSAIKSKMEYYIEPAEQTDEVNVKIKDITPNTLNPEELTLLDPACGSGHILVEAYDLLKEIYLERGYRKRDIPELILTKNLYGLEIDDRAAQLAGFAVMMKARADDRNIFDRDTQPNIVSIQESSCIKAESGFVDLVNLFEHAKTYGSLIRVPENLAVKLPELRKKIEEGKQGLSNQDLWTGSQYYESLLPLVKQAEILFRRYDVVVANPPYMGNKYLNTLLKQFMKDEYNGYEKDLFSAFIIRNREYAKETGDLGFMSPFVWMFISSHEHLRTNIIETTTLTSLIQLEYSGFAEATVPICTFTLNNKHLKEHTSSFIRLSRFRGADNQAPKTLEAIKNKNCGWFYCVKPDDFKKIPGLPIAYWASDKFRTIFTNSESIVNIADARQGLATADNDRFLRLWHEINFERIGFNMVDRKDAQQSGKKWFPYKKGGPYRKWYGNSFYVVNWENDGKEIYGFRPKSVIRNPDYFFKESLSWSDITSAEISFKYFPKGYLFDVKGHSAFVSNGLLYVVLGLLNCKIISAISKILNPTLSFQVGNFRQIPYIQIENRDTVDQNVAQLIGISKSDWDAFETSWDFCEFSMLSYSLKGITVKEGYSNWGKKCNDNIKRMKELEEENNRLFIEAYGSPDELTPDVPEEQIALARANINEDMKRLISYAVGCMMGRYSLDVPGLVYAHAGNDGFDHSKYTTFSTDDDGIVPITDTEWFDDDLACRFFRFIETAWSKDTLEDNLEFIADAIGRKTNESSRDYIRRYFVNGFFKDHLMTYKKRPIYWLFTSGKEKAFQALAYLHRYNEGTLSRMRTEYVLSLQSKITTRMEHLGKDKDHATSTSAANKIQKEIGKLRKQKEELLKFDENLHHYADKKISLNLDDGVKVNYGKFGDLLAEVKAVTGRK